MWIWMIISAVCAYFVKGLCGFANTLVFSSIMGFHSANVTISPMELILGYPSNFIMAVRNRKKINRKVCIQLLSFVIIGCIPGMILLKNVDTTAIKILFGFVVLLVGLEMLIREFTQKKGKTSAIVMGIIGILSGLLCGLFGIGALLAAYMGRVTEDTEEFKTNMGVVFFVENTIRIVAYTMMGIITVPIFLQALALFPAMFVGLFLGMKSSKLLNEKIVKKIVVIMLMISGVALILTNI